MQADSKQITRLLKTARGQIDGILKMVEEDRYCIDISHQISACEAVLKRANKEVLAAHMTHCVHDAVNSDDCDQKIDEMIKVLDNLFTKFPTTPIGIVSPTPWYKFPTTAPNNDMELYVQKLELICKRRDVVYTYNIINAKIVL